MKDLRSKVQHLPADTRTQNVKNFLPQTENIYKSLAVISKRADQLMSRLNVELNSKLEEFIVNKDEIQEIEENKEQIEISKFYERLANPALIATDEFLNEKLDFRYRDEE